MMAGPYRPPAIKPFLHKMMYNHNSHIDASELILVVRRRATFAGLFSCARLVLHDGKSAIYGVTTVNLFEKGKMLEPGDIVRVTRFAKKSHMWYLKGETASAEPGECRSDDEPLEGDEFVAARLDTIEGTVAEVQSVCPNAKFITDVMIRLDAFEIWDYSKGCWLDCATLGKSPFKKAFGSYHLKPDDNPWEDINGFKPYATSAPAAPPSATRRELPGRRKQNDPPIGIPAPQPNTMPPPRGVDSFLSPEVTKRHHNITRPFINPVPFDSRPYDTITHTPARRLPSQDADQAFAPAEPSSPLASRNPAQKSLDKLQTSVSERIVPIKNAQERHPQPNHPPSPVSPPALAANSKQQKSPTMPPPATKSTKKTPQKRILSPSPPPSARTRSARSTKRRPSSPEPSPSRQKSIPNSTQGRREIAVAVEIICTPKPGDPKLKTAQKEKPKDSNLKSAGEKEKEPLGLPQLLSKKLFAREPSSLPDIPSFGLAWEEEEAILNNAANGIMSPPGSDSRQPDGWVKEAKKADTTIPPRPVEGAITANKPANRQVVVGHASVRNSTTTSRPIVTAQNKAPQAASNVGRPSPLGAPPVRPPSNTTAPRQDPPPANPPRPPPIHSNLKNAPPNNPKPLHAPSNIIVNYPKNPTNPPFKPPRINPIANQITVAQRPPQRIPASTNAATAQRKYLDPKRSNSDLSTHIPPPLPPPPTALHNGPRQKYIVPKSHVKSPDIFSTLQYTTLKELFQKEPRDKVNVIAVVGEVFEVVMRNGKPKRDIRLYDGTIGKNWTTTSIWIDPGNFLPKFGTVIAFRNLEVHKWENRSLNAYANNMYGQPWYAIEPNHPKKAELREFFDDLVGSAALKATEAQMKASF